MDIYKMKVQSYKLWTLQVEGKITVAAAYLSMLELVIKCGAGKEGRIMERIRHIYNQRATGMIRFCILRYLLIETIHLFVCPEYYVNTSHSVCVLLADQTSQS